MLAQAESISHLLFHHHLRLEQAVRLTKDALKSKWHREQNGDERAVGREKKRQGVTFWVQLSNGASLSSRRIRREEGSERERKVKKGEKKK
jgi:hypothetical protein